MSDVNITATCGCIFERDSPEAELRAQICDEHQHEQDDRMRELLVYMSNRLILGLCCISISPVGAF